MAQTNRSVPEVLQDIVGHLQDIVRSEVRLAKTEIKEEASKLVKPTARVAVGSIFVIYAGGLALLTIVYALSMVLVAWMAALLVSVLAGIIGLIFITVGQTGLQKAKLPAKTIKTLEENAEWAKNQTR